MRANTVLQLSSLRKEMVRVTDGRSLGVGRSNGDCYSVDEKFVIRHTGSELETIALGRRLGTFLRGGDVVALTGELGSGKTCFTKGIALGLCVPKDIIVNSPSFSLVNEYSGRHPLFHMDAYRLENLSDLISAGLDEYFYQDGIVVVEWADRWSDLLPSWRVKVDLSIVNEYSRRVALSGNHQRALEILENMNL